MHIFPQYYIIMPEQGTKMNRCNTKPRFLGDFRTWWNEATRIGNFRQRTCADSNKHIISWQSGDLYRATLADSRTKDVDNKDIFQPEETWDKPCRMGGLRITRAKPAGGMILASAIEHP